MKQMLVEIEDDVAAKLEQVAPARSRRRSEFIRTAIRRALWELEERETAEAYRTQPDTATEAYFDPSVWQPEEKTQRTRGKR
jgi:predicted transcriptional regulator